MLYSYTHNKPKLANLEGTLWGAASMNLSEVKFSVSDLYFYFFLVLQISQAKTLLKSPPSGNST